MSIKIKDIRYKNTLDTSVVDWFAANVGDEVTIEIDFDIVQSTISSTDSPFILNNRDGYITSGTEIWITGGDFSEFKKGMNIQIENYVGGGVIGGATLHIVEKLSDTEIKINNNLSGWAANTLGTTFIISVFETIQALYYKYNFIENNEALNYISKQDGISEQVAYISGLPFNVSFTDQPLTMLGNKSWQIGNMTLSGSFLLVPYTSKFTLKHTTRLTPITLEKPDYYLGANALKFVYGLEARYNNTDPYNVVSIEKSEELGNTGWFNENFNKTQDLFKIDVLNSSVEGLKIKSGDQTLIFNIIKSDASLFPVGTKAEINFCIVDADKTIDLTKTMVQNTLWDSAVRTMFDGLSSGSFICCTEIILFADVGRTYLRPQIKVNFSNTQIDYLKTLKNPYYQIFVSVKTPSLTGGLSDLTTIRAANLPLLLENQFTNLITFASKRIPHTVNDYTTIFENRNGSFVEDELVCYTKATIIPDVNVTELVLKKYEVEIFQTASDGEFILENYSIDLPTDVFVSGIQKFDISINNSLHVQEDEIRKKIVARHISGNDYEFAYPFQIRWEKWEKLLGVSSDFYDVTKPFNGFNHEWINFGSFGIRHTITAIVNGIEQTYSSMAGNQVSTGALFPYNYTETSSLSEHTTAEIRTFSEGMNEITPYISKTENTVLQCEFINTDDKYPTIGNIHVLIGIETFEKGGIYGKRSISDLHPRLNDNWFLDVMDLQFFDIISGSHTRCRATVTIDKNKLDLTNTKFKITARIFGDGFSVGHGNINHGRNYLAMGEFIAVNDAVEVSPVITNLDCCNDVWKVLASTDSEDYLKNDFNSFPFFLDANYIESASVYIELIKQGDDVPIQLTGSTTYGFEFSSENNQNEIVVGYTVAWRQVLIDRGEGIYRIKCTSLTTIGGSAVELFSEYYQLCEYNDYNSKGTVVIEYAINGLLGDPYNDDRVRDFGNLQWTNQHRFDGIFFYQKSGFKTEKIVYKNGNSEFIEDDQKPLYKLIIKPVKSFKHKVLRTEILMANEILITDYNPKNIDKYIKQSVVKSDSLSYEPDWSLGKSDKAGVVLELEQRVNNYKKYRN